MITKCMKRKDSICGGYDIILKKRIYCDECKKRVRQLPTYPKEKFFDDETKLDLKCMAFAYLVNAFGIWLLWFIELRHF